MTLYSIYKAFHRTGALLFSQGLISITAGNMSMRKGNSIFITASGSLLGSLMFEDIVEAPFNPSMPVYSWNKKKPSVELLVHRAIYEYTDHTAIVHVHSPIAVAMTYDKKELVLPDEEAQYHIPFVPVLAPGQAIASEEVAARLPNILRETKAVIIRGHGVFAAADSIEAAAGIASTVEFSARILQQKSL